MALHPSENKTLPVGTTWIWELFPYSQTYPTAGEFGAGAPGAPNLVPTSESASSFVGPSVGFSNVAAAAFNAGQLAVTGGGESVTVGIKSFSVNRTKNSPDSTANISIVGRPPKHAYPGVWCCLTTVTPSDGKKRVRFVGQIDSMTVNYQTESNGLVTTVTSYRIREWSSVLRVPVRVEALTISQQMNDPSAFNAATFAQAKLGEKVWVDLIKASYNPFDMANLVLQLLGAVSSDNSKNALAVLDNKGYYETAARMPVIPPALIARLGIKDTKNMNPFASGFVQFINGVRKGTSGNPKIYTGNWNGVFGVDGVETIKDYQSRHEVKNTGRPVGSNIAPLMSLNHSGWDLLTEYCDPAHNEFFTDMYYEQDENGNEVTQPVFVFRDKPFLLKMIKDVMPNANQNLIDFSLFDTLPRTRIDPASIMALTFSNTIINSPNLIRVDWTDGMTAGAATRQASNARGYGLLVPEMLRHGGQEFNATTNFVNLHVVNDLGFSSADWWAKVRDVVTAWHSYNYRMGSGSLVIKDYNAPVTIGHNVQFRIGQFVLVGHVESINFSVTVDEKGLIQNTMQLGLSRIVQLLNGKLIFVSPTQFGSFTDPEAVPEVTEPPAQTNFTSAEGQIGAAAAAITGVLNQ